MCLSEWVSETRPSKLFDAFEMEVIFDSNETWIS